MVLEKFGTPAWEDILDGAGMPRETAWVSYEYYPDGVTVELVLSAAKKLGAGADDVLQIFGGYFVKYLKDNQLDKLIHIMGDNLKDFLWNLDYLHAHLQDTFPSASFPHFRVEDLGESKGFTLFYQSSRGALLAPFVQGLVKAISMELFKTEVEMTYEVTEKGAVFHILNNPSAAAAAAEKKEQDALIQAPFRTVDSNESVSPTELSDGYVVAAASLQEAGLDMSFFLQCWPFFMLLDSDMHITACGTSLHARIPEATEGGVRFADLFEVLRPHAAQEDVSFASFLLHTNVTFKVQSKEAIGKSGTKLVLRGAMHHQGGKLLFLASAHMLGIDDMVALGCHMSELPLHDAARDLLFMSETRTAEAHLNKRLDRLSKELAQEQVRSDELLHSMLPSSVVEDLREGRKARGKHHEAVTILFSDIVGFTDISSLNKPQQVCNMLDELYTCFDTISSYFDVYKVETIGDAYMIAGGIVGDVNKHATAVADMAFAMHAGAKLIRAPHNGEPIHIRVGIHTGPAMTGVVGIKMPRFCFFGDTVNTASRMEINGPCP
ncbi:hypothetical protein T484DRAFT_1664823 [Baffinella frigidus]|nr:hypothetical protein T484DRAFT_1664823 [Cryptophyta sp. CCMP2293]